MLNKEMVANPLVVTLEGTDKVRPMETLNYVLQLRFCSLHAPTCKMFLVEWFLRRRWRISPKRCAWPHRRCTTVPTRSKSWRKRFVKRVNNINKLKVSIVMLSKRSAMPMTLLLGSLRKRGFMPSGRSMRRPQRRPGLLARPMRPPPPQPRRCLRSMLRLVEVLHHPQVVAQLRLVERHLLLYLRVNNLPYGLVARFAEMQKQIYDSAQSDAGSDAGSEAGDFPPERAEELAALKKRSMEGAMADADQTRMEDLMFEKAHTRSAKRMRRVQREVGAGFKELFKAAVAEMPPPDASQDQNLSEGGSPDKGVRTEDINPADDLTAWRAQRGQRVDSDDQHPREQARQALRKAPAPVSTPAPIKADAGVGDPMAPFSAPVPGGFELEASKEALRWSPKTISIVLPCAEERDLAYKTVQSAFENTPSEVLHEIVVVDDGSNPPLADTHLKADVQRKFRVKIERHESTVGLIGAKKTGGDRLAPARSTARAL
ncbi:unnamed protein product, partial [Prorocentrum cordatum]